MKSTYKVVFSSCKSIAFIDFKEPEKHSVKKRNEIKKNKNLPIVSSANYSALLEKKIRSSRSTIATVPS